MMVRDKECVLSYNHQLSYGNVQIKPELGCNGEWAALCCPSLSNLTHLTQKSFKPCKAFTGYCQEDKEITALSFDDTGSTCVTASTDDTIHLFDTKLGK